MARADLPRHALTVRPTGTVVAAAVTKGIVDRRLLADAVARAASCSPDGRAVVESCPSCGHRVEVPGPGATAGADPAECPWCNP